MVCASSWLSCNPFSCCFGRKNYYLDDKDGGTPSTTEDDADQRDQPESQSGSMRAVGSGAASRPYDEKPFVGGVIREETRPFLNGTGPVFPSLPREERLGTNDEDNLIGDSGPPNAELSAFAQGVDDFRDRRAQDPNDRGSPILDPQNLASGELFSVIGRGELEHIESTKTASLSTELRDDGEQDAKPIISPTSRTDRMFLDRLDNNDEDDLTGACHRLNVEISNCTQWVVDDWSQARHSQDQNERSERELSRLDSQNPALGEVLIAIGGEMLERIKSARAVPSTTELEDIVEFALRSWTSHCAATYIFALLPTASVVEDERMEQFIVRRLGEIGPCAQISCKTFANSE